MKNKKTHIELLRIIAIYLVLFNHTWIFGFSYFNSVVDTPMYWVYLFFSILVKIDVPIFFMISGALLLNKEESIEDLIKKRFFRFIIVILLFSLISYIYLVIKGNVDHFSIIEYLKMTYEGSITPQYWFLYRYLAFLLLLPLLRPMVKNISNKTMHYIFLLYLTVQVVFVLQYLVSDGRLSYNGCFELFIMQDLIIFPLLGYYIENRLPEEKQTTSLLIKCTVASIIVLMTSCLLTYHSCTIIGEWQEATCQTFFNTFIIIPTGTVYLGIKMLFMKKTFSETIIKIITVVGSCTFGIYLLEQIYREETIDIYVKENGNSVKTDLKELPLPPDKAFISMETP